MAALHHHLFTENTIQFPSFIFDPGIHEYVNPDNPGFMATLKSTPEDFVVTEINCDEKLVVLDNFEVPPLPPPSPLPVNTCMDTSPSDPAPSDSTPTTYRKRKWREDSSRPDPDAIPPLKDLVSLEQYHSLKQLSEEYKTTLIADPDKLIDLGIISGKDARGLLHYSVRLTFPVLCTPTYKDKQGDTGVCVTADSKYKRLVELLSSDEAEKVLKFVNTAQGNSLLELTPDPSREHRTKVHHLLSELYGYSVITKCSTTMTTPYQFTPKVPKLEEEASVPEPYIVIRMKTKRKTSLRKHGGGETLQEEAKGTARSDSVGARLEVVTKFVLWKRNQEFFAVIQKLSRLCHCNASKFNICGMKDKVAVTTQEVTVRGITANRLLQVRDKLNLDEINIGNFEYVSQSLRLGEHSGNHFKVILRDLKPKGEEDNLEHVVTSAIEHTKKYGFINYFGLQRFSRKMDAPRVGVAILQDNLRAAVGIALLGSGRMNKEGKDFIRKGDFKGALDSFSVMSTERLMLQALNQYGASDYGYHRAIMSIPFMQRQFYLHSLSSVIWNHVASYRLQEYGPRPVEGDLVLRKEGWKKREWQQVGISSREWVHELTSHDIANKNYTLEDVVLPVAGSSVILPGNKVKDKILEIVGAIGISLAAFCVPRLQMNCTGTYRKLIVCPKNFSWKLTRKNPPSLTTGTPAQALVITSTSSQYCTDEGQSQTTSSADDSADKFGLELDFDLPTSSYATMFIRELAKNIY